eukprot:CAMPEP_0201664598 /NCGR_PEP_ID=MMETSP0494-20130426/6004_1 /ASSEMBLY_ACC=CAM_ASM_000839 /TAXON_ID=420259 /ORGANISM="Thalassiosira gravida, Strain GMp14c1" /LENGTH=1236 /DNA_ID=CAMNT_0048143389 /DNA_START=714 /DNA_END=4424 /DNA_ORIENTATION=+
MTFIPAGRSWLIRLISVLLAISSSFALSQSGPQTTSLSHSATASAINDKNHNNNEKKLPNNFLRWRKTTSEENRGSTTTNKNNNKTISNDFNNNSGTFLTFDSLGLQLGPISVKSENKNDDGMLLYEKEMELVRYALEAHLNETFRLLFDAVSSNDFVGGHFGFTKVDNVRFVQVVQVADDNKRRALRHVNNMMDDAVVPNVRTRQHDNTRKLQPSSSSSIILSFSGRAFYLYGLGGMLMSIMPRPGELNTLVTNGVEKNKATSDVDNDNVVGGMLASRIRELASSSSSSGGDFGNVEIFENVEIAMVIDLPTPSPTAPAPSMKPSESFTPFPTDEPGVVNPPLVTPNFEPVVLTDASTDVSTAPSPGVSEPMTFSPVGLSLPGVVADTPQTTTTATAVPTLNPAVSSNDSQEGDAGTTEANSVDTGVTDSTDDAEVAINDESGNIKEDEKGSFTGDLNKVGEGGAIRPNTIAGATNAAQSTIGSKNAANDDEGDKRNTIIIFMAVGGSLVALSLSVVVVFFVQKRRRRRGESSKNGDDDDEQHSGGGISSKGVPMSKLTDDDDNYDDVYGDMYNGMGETTSQDASKDRSSGEADREASQEMATIGYLERSTSPNAGIIGTVASSGGALQIIAPSPQASCDLELRENADHAYNKMMANALGSSSGGMSNNANNAPSPQDDDSVIPQIEPKEQATFYDQCCGTAISNGDSEVANNAKDLPLSSQDSLDKNYPSAYSFKRTCRINNAVADEKEQSLANQESLVSSRDRSNNSNRSQNIADLDILMNDQNMADFDVLINNMSSISATTASEDIVYDDIEEATRLANDVTALDGVMARDGNTDFAGDVFGGTHTSTYENNIQTLNFIRENLAERSSSQAEEPTSYRDGNLNSNSFASHEILKNINEAVARKRSTESSKESASMEIEQVVEFASYSNDVADDAMGIPTGFLEERKSPISIDPEENNMSHGILWSISEAVRSTPVSILRTDSYVPVEESNRSNVVSWTSTIPTARDAGLPSSYVDPPGDITSLIPDESESDIFAGLRTVTPDDFSRLKTRSVVSDDRLSSYAAAHTGCTNTFADQTKENFTKSSLMCKQGRNDDDVAGAQTSSSGVSKAKWNSLSSKLSSPCLRDPESAVVSDNENDGDDEHDQNVYRPWKGKWDNDPFANRYIKGSRTRTVSPISSPSAFDSVDSSNYDPDSDWDVDDTEVDFSGSVEESFVASPTNKGNNPQRISDVFNL